MGRTDRCRVRGCSRGGARRLYEPAVVFPALPFGANWGAHPYPGGVAVDNKLLFGLLEGVYDEIPRNGLRKIVIVSGHGSNKWLLLQFVMQMVDKGKNYVLFYMQRRRR